MSMVSCAMRSCFSRRQMAQRAHVVEPVGELHQNHAQIAHHGEQHLADAFSLPLLPRSQLQLAQLGDAVDAARHILAEGLADVLDLGAGVLHDVVEESGFQAHHVHVHLHQLARHQQRMNHVGLSGFPFLIAVALPREAVGAIEGLQILIGAKRQDAVLQLLIYGFDRIGDRRGNLRSRQNSSGVDRIGRHF